MSVTTLWLQDIVAASPANFNIAGFIPKLRDYLRVAHPNKRMFLVSWIMVRCIWACDNMD
jgi:hypothetical protein